MGGEPLLYHQLALRLALEGYDVTGIGPQAVNAKLRREIEDAGGSFQSSSISEISGGDTALAVLASTRPFEALNWAAQHRIHISSEPRAPTSPRWKSAVIIHPVELAQVVLSDIVDQVVALLDCPPCTHSVRYSALPDGTHFRRVIRQANDATDSPQEAQEDVADLPAEGIEVKPTAYGHGVFAARSHRQGERVMQTSGVLLNHQTEHSIQIGLRQHLEPRFPVRLINHSCVPNLGVRTTAQGLPDFYALRDIEAGEELNFDYAMTELTHVPRANLALEFSLKCHCGEADCRGQLGYYSTLPESHKRRYEGYISAYLLALEPRQPVSTMVGGLTEPTSK
ncbi:hypothetical protein GCM10008957_16040 [Deinococcus ruber]|uniref:SET domain-containing protein n=2 Tax=Deinococcus ruber TaxID=1848197 RepID=A0A918F5V0_9DEIO|nr:hypothetical protein GCM10008957_16040 [Deinococcus ruber]